MAQSKISEACSDCMAQVGSSIDCHKILIQMINQLLTQFDKPGPVESKHLVITPKKARLSDDLKLGSDIPQFLLEDSSHESDMSQEMTSEYCSHHTEETLIGKLRRHFKPRIPRCIQSLPTVHIMTKDKTSAVGSVDQINRLFPETFGQPLLDFESLQSLENHENDNKQGITPTKTSLRVGVVLSGGQAPGGHNVIIGLFDALKELNPHSTLIGFTGGLIGLTQNRFIELRRDFMDRYRNTGGFDMIQSGRCHIHHSTRMMALRAATSNQLDGLVIIGGDGSNSNAAVLSEFFAKHQSRCRVVGVPKTIDGDLQNEYIEVSFGFDSAVKTYSHLISNIARDAKSAGKTWHFIKLMGRDASQVALDCALQTQPNITLIGEEIQEENMLLHDIAENMCDVIEERALNGKNYGVILIPEGIIQFMPSMKVLIDYLNTILAEGTEYIKAVEGFTEISDKIKYVRSLLKATSPTNLSNFDVLPRDIQAQLLLERAADGHIQIAQVPIEQLFMQICAQKLKRRKKYVRTGYSFRSQGHYFGYDGRCCFPSNFDAQYCTALGRVGTLLIAGGYNGYMARVYDLEKDVEEWKAGGIPICMLLNIEIRHNKPLPVIQKALVNVESGKKFNYFAERRDEWAVDDCYRYIGPIQLFGPTELTDVPPMNVLLKKTNDTKWPAND